MKTFKQFTYLFEQETKESIEELVKFARENGYIENLTAMIESSTFFYRGSTTMFDAVSGTGKMHIESKKREKQRTTIYSSSKILTNLWHAHDDLPSRKVARFATPNKIMAEDFGKLVILIPKDNSTVTMSPKDYNIGSVAEIQSYFDIDTSSGFSLGDFPQLIGELVASVSNIIEATGDTNDAYALSDLYFSLTIEHKNINEIKRFFKELDYYISKIDESGFKKNGGYGLVFGMFKKFKASGDSFAYIKTFFDEVKSKMVITSDLKKILNILTNDKNSDYSSSEVWWEADSLVVSEMISKPIYKKMVIRALDAAKVTK